MLEQVLELVPGQREQVPEHRRQRVTEQVLVPGQLPEHRRQRVPEKVQQQREQVPERRQVTEEQVLELVESLENARNGIDAPAGAAPRSLARTPVQDLETPR